MVKNSDDNSDPVIPPKYMGYLWSWHAKTLDKPVMSGLGSDPDMSRARHKASYRCERRRIIFKIRIKIINLFVYSLISKRDLSKRF